MDFFLILKSRELNHKSEMARNAIHRRVVLPMAFNAKTHRVIHLALGDRLRVHIAMAFGAVHSRSNVRRVIELHVRGGLKSVNSLPWNVLASRAIGRELFDLRLVGGDHLMARHAEVDARDSGVRALIHADMAVRALHPIGKVHFMGVGDGLHRLGARAEEFPNRVAHGPMRRGEDRRGLRRRLGRGAGIVGGHGASQDRPRQDDHPENHCNAKPTVHTECGQRQITLLESISDRELAILHVPSAAVNPEFRAISRRSFLRARPGIMIVRWITRP